MIQKIIKLFIVFGILINFVFAGNLNHYEVIISPEKASVGEAIDLTIKAVDKDNNVIKDYDGTILIFSESDKKAEFPKTIEENSYKFNKSDEGVVKFENAVKFTKAGKNDIHVYDLNDETDSVVGLAEVEITEKQIEENIKIEILTPPTGTTVGKNTIKVSGKSQKNHQIKIILNNKTEILTTTDKDGIFEKEIEGLENGENVIVAKILNSDSKEIGTSKEILIKSDSTLPILNKLKLTPSGEVEAESTILAEVYSTKGLKEVSVIINDTINILKEDKEGLYKGEFLAPREVGEYKIDVILKNELGAKIEEKDKEILKVIPELESAEIKKETPKKTKKDKCKDGDYSGNVFDGKCGEKPADYNAPIDLKIRDLKIVELKTKSILTWKKLNDAVKYEVYKKLTGDEIELIDTVTEPKYEIQITGEEVKYDYFAVKAIGEKEFTDTTDKTKTLKKELKGDLSDAVKIQTGPKEIIIVLIALLLGFGIFIIGRKKA